ncbi:hypothetical protein Peur_011955 [Populus x canadensis]|uniref:uncharacterized protein LOC133690986 isoform X1 n=1 Tax=Populus nigra TaxID=3691 RepID=UPI002B273E49|nr:uncharacterized protein LOC133690986 isoform X1 [Populus nigra]XP_061967258.1 uncharacterized protein LOC133690986 isoform X1 [Populus nigra]
MAYASHLIKHSKKLRNVSSLMRHEHAGLVRWLSNDFHVSGGKRNVIEELNVQENMNFDKGISRPKLKTTWAKQAEVIKEPYMCSPLQNLLLFFPGCVSADESGNRLFLSDSNHHRIIVSDGNGKILDSIGSGPGFEDGEFESAKLARPAASFYDDEEDCLYIVDSENHAIRRADLESRVLETVYPKSFSKKNNSIWTWIMDKLGSRINVDAKSEEFDSQPLVFPWHLLKSVDNTFLIISRSFEALWVIDLVSGEMKECIKGFPNILETCGQLITGKVSLLKQLPIDYLKQQTDVNCSLKEFPYATLVSNLTTFENDIVLCDTVAHRVLKISRESGACSNFQLSNFGILGLPFWLSFPVERVYSVAGASADHIEHVSLLPGRVDIRLNIDIPMDTELVEPLQEGCIWRQARGSATVILGAEDVVGSSEKAGVSQQWYDELDNLAFSTPGLEVATEEDSATSDVNYEDERLHIDCAVNTSPGTSELIIHAALYLKLRRHLDLEEGGQQKHAARIADILNPGRGEGLEKDSCIQLLLKSNCNLRDLIFVKPLHLRINLDTLDHPKADNSKDIILTDSAIEVNVSL